MREFLSFDPPLICRGIRYVYRVYLRCLTHESGERPQIYSRSGGRGAKALGKGKRVTDRCWQPAAALDIVISRSGTRQFRKASVEYNLQCECGQSVAVDETLAGTAASCACGRAIVVPSLRDLRRIASADVETPPSAISGANKLEEQAEEPAVRAGRQVMIGVLAGVLILETAALLVVGIFFRQIGSAAIRIPIHLVCFALLWAGVPEMRPIYVFILGAVGGFSVYQFFGAGLRGAGIPDALRLICGVLFLLFAHRLLTDRDIDKFLAIQRDRFEKK